MERKLEAMLKAKNHYKEQWSRALQEIALIKKKEEENAKAQLKKQQLELEHLRLRYLAAEESDLVMKTSKDQMIRGDLEKWENIRLKRELLNNNAGKKRISVKKHIFDPDFLEVCLGYCL